MPQGPIPVSVSNLVSQGVKNKANISASTVVKAGPGTILRVSVVTAGSSVGTINDCLTTAAAAVGNQVGTIPDAIGNYEFQMPCTTGIVVVPGTGQVVAVSYI